MQITVNIPTSLIITVELLAEKYDVDISVLLVEIIEKGLDYDAIFDRLEKACKKKKN